MPPKCKFTEEEITKAALELTRTEGLSALTARALGVKLGSSSRPIFSVFESMDEVQEKVIASAKKLYADYVEEGLHQKDVPAFKGVGIQYIRFAMEEPKLFQILFMTEQEEKPDVLEVLPVIEDSYPQILSSVMELYSMEEEKAKRLYRHLWIYSHGIAVLIATKLCVFSSEEIGEMLTDVCIALIRKMKGEEYDSD